MTVNFARYRAARERLARQFVRPGRRLRRWRNAWAVLCAFVLGVSTNVFAAAVWDQLSENPSLSIAGTLAWALASVLCFSGAISWLYRHWHRILTHRARMASRPREPRRVLVMGLSDLGRQQPAAVENLLEHIRGASLSLSDFDRSPAAITADYDQATSDLRWLQNLRLIAYHRDKIERILVVISRESQPQFRLFAELVRAVIGNTPGLAERGITVAAVGKGADFEDYNSIQDAIEEAVLRAREKDPAGRAYNADDISVDVTSGTKQFSMPRRYRRLSWKGAFSISAMTVSRAATTPKSASRAG